MAKAINVIGGLKGKVGSIVYATVKGETIARVYQPVVANPNTVRQQVSREKMSMAGRACRGMMNMIRAGWNNVASGREFQQAVRKFIPVDSGIITGTVPGNLEMQYSLLAAGLSYPQFSAPVTFSGQPDLETEGEAKIDWTVNTDLLNAEVGGAANVGLVLMAYMPDIKASITKYVADITAGTVTWTVGSELSGLRAYFYAIGKVKPEAKNGVSQDTLPWMYPSKASVAIYLGSGDFA